MNKQENPSYAFLLELVKEIQDEDYQERVWVKGEGPECSDFIEAMNGFLDFFEAIQEVENRYLEYGISFNQYRLLKSLYDQLSDYCDVTPVSPDNREILADPRWRKIRDFAKQVYAKLTKSEA